MTPIGRSGTSDADMSNMLGENTGARPPNMARDALGEPVDVAEVVRLETIEPTPTSVRAQERTDAPGRFRWWYVPAVALPVTGAAAAVTLAVRRRRPVSRYQRIVASSRDWLDQVGSSKATRSAARSLHQGATSLGATVRGSTQQL